MSGARISREQQAALNDEHLIRPRPGDMWEEMFCVVYLVIWSDGEHLEYLDAEHKEDAGHHTWRWVFDKPAHRKLITEFAANLRYGSIPGTWADVHPGNKGHAYAVECALEARQKRAP